MDPSAALSTGFGMKMLTRLSVMLKLARVSNLPTVWSNCIVGWLLGGGEFSSWLYLSMLMLGASLAYSAGMVMNDAVDAGYDSEHRPERPLPSGEIKQSTAWGLAISLLGSGLVLLLLAGAWPFWVLLLTAMIVSYNVLHKRWQGAVYIMGGCRLVLYLTAASVSVNGGWFREMVLIWALALGVYTVGITLAARGEAEDKGTGLGAISLLAAPLFAAGWMYFSRVESGMTVMVCLVLWAGWTAYSVLILRGDEEGRVARAVSLLIAGMLLVDAVAISAAYDWLGIVLVAALPPVLILQKRIAAT